MLNNNFQNNNLNKLDTLGKIQMQRDQELNMPSQIRSVHNAYDNQNVMLQNPTIQNIPQALPRNQNIMMQPLQPNYANLLNQNQNQNQNQVYENFTNYKPKSKGIKGLFKSLLSNMKQNIILLLIFTILNLQYHQQF
jgi:hypothetical protein